MKKRILEKLNKFDLKCDNYLSRMNLLAEWRLNSPINGLKVTDQDSQRRNLIIFNRIIDELEKSFSHICGSPERDEIFYKSYCWPESGSNLSDENRKDKFELYTDDIRNFYADINGGGTAYYVNFNDHCIERFVQHLCGLSKKNKKNKTTDNDNRIIFLTGDYGEGKTFFINYIQSTKQNVFDTYKVVNIKIDYADKYIVGVKKIDIALADKTNRIVREKYFNKNKFDINKFIEFAKQSIGEGESLKNIKNYIKYGESFTLNDDDSKKCFYIIKKFLLDDKINGSGEQYSFLFIIDGMDNVNRDTISQDRFYDKVKSLKTFLKNKVKDSCYLITMRPESHHYLERQCNEGKPRINDMVNVELFHANPYSIIDRKFEVFKEFLLTSSSEDKELPDYTKNFVSVVNDFKMFLLKYFEIDFMKRNKNLKFNLNDLFNDNNRDIMNAILAISRDIFSRIEFSGDVNNWESASRMLYKFMKIDHENIAFVNYNSRNFHRALMHNRRFYTLEQYEYEISSNDNFDIDQGVKNNKKKKNNIFNRFKPIRHNNFHERSLIPNLFYTHNPFSSNFELIDKKINEGQLPCYCKEAECLEDKRRNLKCIHSIFLIKIRILQYYNYYNDRNQILNYLQDVAATINNDFSYPVELIKSECDMLYSLQCLGKIRYQHDGSRYNPIYNITPLGKYLLSDLIYSYSYIENVIDNCILPSEFCSKYMIPPVSLSKIQDYWNVRNTDGVTQYLKLADSFSEKIIRIKAFVNFIKNVEKMELASLETFKEDYPPYVYSDRGRYFIHTLMSDNINKTIDSLLSSSTKFTTVSLLNSCDMALDVALSK